MYFDILREPDSVLVQREGDPLRFEETQSGKNDPCVTYSVEGDCARVLIAPDTRGIRFVKLRWNGDLSQIKLLYRTTWARSNAANPDGTVGWMTLTPHILFPWYFHAYDGERTDSYGVQTGPDAFCSWQIDPFGVALWLDLRCGNEGVLLKESLCACTVLGRRGLENESSYSAAQDFMRMLCPAPRLPRTPVFGANNWYWAYGSIDHAQTVRETEYLASLCEGTTHKPYMVIDDGWQGARFKGQHSSYNGGPWNRTNEAYPSGTMQAAADAIRERGALPGIWFRPLLTLRAIPDEVEHTRPGAGYTGRIMDPSHPYTLEKVREDAARIASWGFALIKHDFSSSDAVGEIVPSAIGAPWHFHDVHRTSAQILKGLYSAIQESAGVALVLGCDVFGHLCAGIHELYRTGGDTSGRSFEWTRRNGVQTLQRLPENNAFYRTDPDCPAFTDRVPHEANLDFLEACAITGSAAIASITPGSLTKTEFARAQELYHIADRTDGSNAAEPLDWMQVASPSRYLYEGREHIFNWYRHYDGTRQVLSWMQ